MSKRVTPTGVIRYNPDKCWNGLTIIPKLPNQSTAKGAALYDMNGNIVQKWEGLYGAFDNKMLPGGSILGTTGYAKGFWLNCLDLVQLSWDGEVEWKFNNATTILDINTGKNIPTAGQHHDFQREGSPVGYYTPDQLPKMNGKTLLNSSLERDLPEFSPVPYLDTLIIEIDETGNVLWSWSLFDHWDQLGMPTVSKILHKTYTPIMHLTDTYSYAKETYCNNINYVGPNKWYDAGDERFNPENIITDIRALNISFIIDKKSGDIVWKIGPEFESTVELQKIGQIVGQHHVHIIPKGLPGEGNVLLYDNGGQAGIGSPAPCAPTGYFNATRSYSRVLEINPITLEVVWSYNDEKREFKGPSPRAFENLLFSEYCSSADRLPNGNTMITETIHGRVIEVTPDREIVWEFINPGGPVFRAHRYPYDWFPQVEKPTEIPVTPVRNYRIRLDTDGKPYLVDEDPFFE